MAPGDVLARSYVLEARLGEGGMGEVWRAKRLRDGERVAVKVLRRELADDESSKRRFAREARAAMAVRHPNVVTMLDVHDTSDAPFLVMELLTGETLGKRLRRKGALGVGETAAILLPVFDAVEAAHAAGIVHRDLKPENVFLAVEGETVRVRVLDFGIAKRLEKLASPMGPDAGETTATAATTGSMIGTPYYMAPEQALGERDIDGRADLWSLGVILYECLSGKRPTEATTLGGVLKILVTGSIAPLGDVAPDLDPELADEVMDLLRSDRGSRATSLTALRTSLETLAPRDAVLDVPREAPSEPPPSLAKSAAAAKRSRWTLPVVAVSVVSAGALALVLARVLEAPAAATVPAPSATMAPASRSAETASSPAPSIAAPIPAVPAAPSITAAPTTSHGPLPPARAGEKAPPIATSAPAAGAPSRGPSGLVTDNPFAR